MNDIMTDIVNDKKGHNIVNDSFAHKPDGFPVLQIYLQILKFVFILTRFGLVPILPLREVYYDVASGRILYTETVTKNLSNFLFDR